VEANALPLFHDLEQTQGPFGANASTENTRVVQTRVQEIHANETAAVVGISCSVTFGQADLGVTPSCQRRPLRQLAHRSFFARFRPSAPPERRDQGQR